MSIGTISAQMLNDFDANQNITMEGWPNLPTIVANPDATGINTSANCAEFVRSTEQWAHSYSNLANALDFSTNNAFKLKAWSPIACTVLFKLETQSGTGGTVEVPMDITTPNQWTQLEFAFPGATSNLYDKIVIFFDFATMVDNTFFFDDLEFVGGTGPNLTQISLPVTFQDTTVDYTVTDFGGNVSVLGPDPMNASNVVAITTKDNLAETWAGTTIGTPLGFSSAVPFTASDTKMSVKVYSPAVGLPIRLKVEDHNDNTQTCETEALTTVANTWETLEFDFSNEAAGTAALNLSWTFDMASIFFDFGTAGAGDVFYWDDVEFMGGGNPLTQISLPVTFDDPTVDYTVTDFGGNITTIQADPVVSTNQVAFTTKGLNAETWAGTTISTPMGFSAAVPFTSVYTKMTVQVYAPAVGLPIRLKVEDHSDNTHTCETEALTTVANAWETLEFDFSNEAAGTAALNLSWTFDMASIFFDFGTMGDDDVFYWDDVRFISTNGTESLDMDAVSIYPNPVNDILNIDIKADADMVSIYNILGIQVYAEEVENDNLSIDVSGFSEGVYIVTILNANNIISLYRLIKRQNSC